MDIKVLQEHGHGSGGTVIKGLRYPVGGRKSVLKRWGLNNGDIDVWRG